jgi:lipopolysaccharide export system protein LptA
VSWEKKLISEKIMQAILKFSKYFLSVLLLIVGALSANAQAKGVPIEVRNADSITLQKLNDSVNLQILIGNVILKQGKSTFYCDRCIKNEFANTFEAWGKVHINDSDTTNIYSDHLRYLTDKQIAYLDGNAKLTDGHAVLTTPSAEYNMATNIATYKNGGKVVNKTSVITSKAANYYTDIKDVIFMNDVKVNDPAYKINTDSLLYNTETQIARFITYTVIRDSANRTITTRDGFYNLKTGDAEFTRRTMVNDDNKTTVIADSLTLTEEFAQAKGRAVVVDSVRSVIILSNLIYQNRISEAVLATQHPLAIIKQDNDSIYIASDTMFSAKLTELYANTSSEDSVHQKPVDSLHNTAPETPAGESFPNNLPQDSTVIKMDSTTMIMDSTMVADSLKTPEIPAPRIDSLSNNQNKNNRQNSKIPLSETVKSNDVVMASPKKNTEKPPLESTDSTRQISNVKNTEPKNKINENDSTNRYFEAYHHVRIFINDSAQAACDSLFYSFRDSIIRFYQNPVIWSQGNQITGDTLLLHTKNKQIYFFEAIGHAYLINHLEQGAFNQVKSSRMYGYFTDGNLDSVRAIGSVEAIYYVQDEDSAYIGVNQVKQTDIIDAYLKNKQLHKIVLRGQTKGTMYPIKQKNPKEMQLEGFIWREEERPKTKYDLLK